MSIDRSVNTRGMWFKSVHDFIVATCAVAFILSTAAHYAGYEMAEWQVLFLSAIVTGLGFAKAKS